MNGLIVTLSIVGYFSIGLSAARMAFVHTLDTMPRYGKEYSTDTYDRARWYAVWSFFGWPVFGICAFIVRSTPHEKLAEREARLAKHKEESEAHRIEIEKLAKEHGL